MKKIFLFLPVLLLCGIFAALAQSSSAPVEEKRKYIRDWSSQNPADSVLVQEIITDRQQHTVKQYDFYNSGNIARQSQRSTANEQEEVITYYESGKIKEKGQFRTARWTGDYSSWFDSSQCRERDLHFDFSGQRDSLQVYYWKNSCNVPQWKFFFRHGREVYYEKFSKQGKRIAHDSIRIQTKADADPEYFLQYNGGSKLRVQDPWPMDTSVSPVKKARIIRKPDPGPIPPPYLPPPPPKKWDGNGSQILYRNGMITKKGTFRNFKLIDGEERIYNSNNLLEKIRYIKGGKYVGEKKMN